MSGTYVTASGFESKILADIKAEIEMAFKEQFGEEIDLDPRAPFGQIVGILAKRDADLWEALQEIYTSRNPNQATGQALDAIVAENGISRRAATPTVVQDVLLYGDEGTTISAGKQARQPGQEIIFTLDSTIVLNRTVARDAYLSLADDPVDGTTYTVTIEGTDYSDTASTGDTKNDVITNIYNNIVAGSWDGSVEVTAEDQLRISRFTSAFNVDWDATFELDLFAGGGNFTCRQTGEVPVPANTLTVIVTTVTEWDSVTNPSTGIQGTETETDEELRLRREQISFTGAATEESIKTRLLEEVDGVIGVSITSNSTDITDGEGRPPHSYEAIVSGGTNQDVADKLWDVQPAGVASYGNLSVNVQDSEGDTQEIQFSRADSKFIWVRVSRSFYSEEDYPSDGDEQIKNNIVEWAVANLDVGVDVIRQRLSIPIYKVPGIQDIVIELYGSTNEGDTPTYAESNVEISAAQLADFDTDRIVVQAI